MLFSSWNPTSDAYDPFLRLRPFTEQEMHVLKSSEGSGFSGILDGDTSEFMVVSLENVTWHFDASTLEVN